MSSVHKLKSIYESEDSIYKLLYFDIVNYYKTNIIQKRSINEYKENPSLYSEKHHINVKWYFKYNCLLVDNSPENLVRLPFIKHVEVHLLLAKHFDFINDITNFICACKACATLINFDTKLLSRNIHLTIPEEYLKELELYKVKSLGYLKNKQWYHNIKTGKRKYFYDTDIIPEDFVLGFSTLDLKKRAYEMYEYYKTHSIDEVNAHFSTKYCILNFLRMIKHYVKEYKRKKYIGKNRKNYGKSLKDILGLDKYIARNKKISAAAKKLKRIIWTYVKVKELHQIYVLNSYLYIIDNKLYKHSLKSLFNLFYKFGLEQKLTRLQKIKLKKGLHRKSLYIIASKLYNDYINNGGAGINKGYSYIINNYNYDELCVSYPDMIYYNYKKYPGYLISLFKLFDFEYQKRNSKNV